MITDPVKGAGSLRKTDQRLLGFLGYLLAGPSVLRNFNLGRDGTGFFKIPGSRDFSGRDYPNIFIPGLMGSRDFSRRDQPKIFIPGFFETNLFKN